MHVRSVDIQNLRALQQFSWSLAAEDDLAGWHVILGDNGSGKSSVLRAVALALVGPDNLHGLRQVGEDWLRKGTKRGTVEVVFERHKGIDTFGTQGAPPKLLGAAVRVEETDGKVSIEANTSATIQKHRANRSVWSKDATGWFVAGFGPFRRFDGGDTLKGIAPSLARVITLFDERFALRDALSWVVDLWVAKQVGQGKQRGLFDRVQGFVNQSGFLPHGAQLARVELDDRKRVLLTDGAGVEVPIEEMSDGFRSVLSLALELLRQVLLAFEEAQVFDEAGHRVLVPGVVLIDEIDAHLHPMWQRRIGDFLVDAFPNMQFLVTTHSALVCRSAGKGSVFLLPLPGQDGQGRMLTHAERDRLVYGNLLDAYGTGAFGVGVEQSEQGRKLAERLAELNGRELLGRALSTEELAEREALRDRLPSSAAATPAASLDALIARLPAAPVDAAEG